MLFCFADGPRCCCDCTAANGDVKAGTASSSQCSGRGLGSTLTLSDTSPGNRCQTGTRSRLPATRGAIDPLSKTRRERHSIPLLWQPVDGLGTRVGTPYSTNTLAEVARTQEWGEIYHAGHSYRCWRCCTPGFLVFGGEYLSSLGGVASLEESKFHLV